MDSILHVLRKNGSAEDVINFLDICEDLESVYEHFEGLLNTRKENETARSETIYMLEETKALAQEYQVGYQDNKKEVSNIATDLNKLKAKITPKSL
jgi:hypothetical protein